MSHVVNLEAVDTDGAIREAAEAVAGDTRMDFLRKGAVGGGALFGGAALMSTLPELAAAKAKKRKVKKHKGGIPASDIAILNFALTLEYLEAAFYAEAVSNGKLSGVTARFAALVSNHETTHVKTLKGVLKSKAVASPRFNFQGTTADQTKFQQTAFVLENTGVHAYLGQAGNLKTGALLGAAASIVTVEARHAAAIATIVNNDPYGLAGMQSITPDQAFDTPLTKQQILDAVKGTGFIVG